MRFTGLSAREIGRAGHTARIEDSREHILGRDLVTKQIKVTQKTHEIKIRNTTSSLEQQASGICLCCFMFGGSLVRDQSSLAGWPTRRSTRHQLDDAADAQACRTGWERGCKNKSQIMERVIEMNEQY